MTLLVLAPITSEGRHEASFLPWLRYRNTGRSVPSYLPALFVVCVCVCVVWTDGTAVFNRDKLLRTTHTHTDIWLGMKRGGLPPLACPQVFHARAALLSGWLARCPRRLPTATPDAGCRCEIIEGWPMLWAEGNLRHLRPRHLPCGMLPGCDVHHMAVAAQEDGRQQH